MIISNYAENTAKTGGDTVITAERETMSAVNQKENQETKPCIIPDIAQDTKNVPVVCFICTGNTCRSPMAAAYLRSRGYLTAYSRGTAANDGDPIAEYAVSALEDAGIANSPDNDYRSHRARTVGIADMARADIIYAVTERHASALFFSYPQYAGKIRVLPSPIADPFGGTQSRYRETLREIIQCIDEIFGFDK